MHGWNIATQSPLPSIQLRGPYLDVKGNEITKDQYLYLRGLMTEQEFLDANPDKVAWLRQYDVPWTQPVKTAKEKGLPEMPWHAWAMLPELPDSCK